MKTILMLLKKSFGLPVLMWTMFFFLWHALTGYYAIRMIDLDISHLMLIRLIGFLLKIWFFGYLFLVATRFVQEKQKTLRPLELKRSFIIGARLLLHFLFVGLPLSIVLVVYYLYFFSMNVGEFIKWYILIYFVLVLIPYFIFQIVHFEKLPLFEGSLTFFKKYANLCFAFTLFSAATYLLWFHFSALFVRLAQAYLGNPWKMAFFVLMPYLLLFYVLFFNAVLAGYFAKKVKDSE